MSQNSKASCAGAGKLGDSGDICVGKTGCVNEGAEGELCGARSSIVYCMDLPATDFRENDMRRHTLGSTCAPALCISHQVNPC